MYAARHNVKLELEGEVGFGRECVGIVCDNGSYPDYEVEDLEWVPNDAYHKHNCVAVLGRGEHAESQLYDWLKWFDDNGYAPELKVDTEKTKNTIGSLLGEQRHARMVKS